jgi:hypothetical protein
MVIDEIGRKRRRKPGDIGSLRRTLWASIVTLEGHLGNTDPQIAIRAAHALGTLSGTYLKALELLELGNLAARLDAVETAERARER